MTIPSDTILENRYRVDWLLAKGGMGAVYRGFDTKLNMPVALKENFFDTPQSIIQFKQEALILARLRHPNLPRVIDHFSFEDQQYLVMDFIDGDDLWKIVREHNRPLTERQALDCVIQVCDAVQYLHRQEPPIIHRDIKPQNIKITPDNQAVLVDFGIAKVGGGDIRTRTGAQGITPGFSPPEQYAGSGTSPASDIYALGATLYAVLTGRKPPDSVGRMVNQAEFIAPDVLNPALSRQTSQSIVYAMQSQLQDRPQSVIAWQQDLEAIRQTLAAAPDEAATVASAEITPLWLIGPAGQNYELWPGSLTLGRAKDCDIRINDRQASRQHAVLEFDGQRCLVYDEGSANGTFINEQLAGTDGRPLAVGDRLRIGDTHFYLSAAMPEAGSETVDVPEQAAIDDQFETTYAPTAFISQESDEFGDEQETAPVPILKSPAEPEAQAAYEAVPDVADSASGLPPWLWIGGGVAFLFLAAAISAVAFLASKGSQDTIIRATQEALTQTVTRQAQLPAEPPAEVTTPIGEESPGAQKAEAAANAVGTAAAIATSTAQAQQTAIAQARQIATANAQETATAQTQRQSAAVATDAARQTATAQVEQAATISARETAETYAQEAATAHAQQAATASAQETAQAALSYGRIAFTSDREGNFDIHVMNADGSGLVNLTNHPADDDSPAWSPDGGRIAFKSDREGVSKIYVMNADGSGVTRLTGDSDGDHGPAWSPDGSRIAFYAQHGNNFDIYVMNADGSGLINLTNNPAGDGVPTWSPDGSRIAFTSNRGGNFDIYVMNADGSGVTNLTNHPSDDGNPAWSPTGAHIAFLSERDGSAAIYIMNTNGSGVARLTNDPIHEDSLVWSPDGGRIAFVSERDGNAEVYVMNANGSGLTNLTNNPATDRNLSWGR